MQIKHVGLPISSNKPSDSQQPSGVTPGAGQEQAAAGSAASSDTLFISSMSGRRLDWLRILLSNPQASLFNDLKEMLGLLSAMRAASGSKEFAGIAASVENALLPFLNSLEARNFSADLVQGIIRLYSHAEDIKLDLLNLLSALPKEGKEALQLKEKISSFLNYLESVNFFNREGATDNAAKTLFLYFPFTVPTPQGKDRKMELVIYPETDSKGKINQNAFSFNLIIDTESLGRVKVFMQVNKNRVSCNVGAESQSAFSVLERSADDLSTRLKKIRFVLNSFDCCEARVDDYLPTLLPRLEMKA